MKKSAPQLIKLKDYKKADFRIEDVYLNFDIHDKHTTVSSKMVLVSNHEQAPALVLDGENLNLKSVKLNNQKLNPSDYVIGEETLTIAKVPKKFTLEIEVEIDPANNLALEGLYKSGDVLCTQNEAQGFRRITYFIDRPDVMTKFKTRIEADKKRYPLLLSNGNRLKSGNLEKGRHFVEWQDPHLKPCYLYALVAGDLALVKDQFITMSGRKVALEIYVDKGNEDKCDWAMKSLKASMKWDEDTFGLEYDLDIYMIVAVDAFNMGAMENKGLNIFNSSYVLAKKQTATDMDFLGVESVIGHEYFHNWTGNRVTCRDWFQLTLKEGLTVFRDQEFSSDLNSRAVKRIQDVRALKQRQFPEDAGPMAHPIRPEAYMEINNFYTATVYEKGSEVIRMVHTLIGEKAFKLGMKKYFELYDGQAVTTENFIHAMEVASKKDLTQFKLWYQQSGTPIVKANKKYNKTKKELTLTFEQFSKKGEKFVLEIPIRYALLSKKGKVLSEGLFVLNQKKQKLILKNIKEDGVISLNRGFSAPIYLEFPYTEKELFFLMASDTDSYNQWDAAQRIYQQNMLKKKPKCSKVLINAISTILKNSKNDPAHAAELLTLTSEAELNEHLKIHNYAGVRKARQLFYSEIGSKLFNEWKKIYLANSKVDASELTAKAFGQRSLKNLALKYLFWSKKAEGLKIVYEQYTKAQNMTDSAAALELICHMGDDKAQAALNDFKAKWKGEALVMNKWFAMQANSYHPDVLKRVQQLANDTAFDKKNPNKIRSLYASFGRNLAAFHAANGSGYKYMAERIIEVDKFNPQIAARMATLFSSYRSLPKLAQKHMKNALEQILSEKSLSGDTFEVVSKTLN
ncbi:MAG: aminopeptidase N [Bacteriovoracaceae bacterium]|nr:aminopeptidase N [Bacteriovoracaceae bacterium]